LSEAEIRAEHFDPAYGSKARTCAASSDHMERLPIIIDLCNPHCGWHAAVRDDATAGEVRTWARGHAWAGRRCYEGAELAQWAADNAGELLADSETQRAARLRELNGSFALVIRNTSSAMAVVDRLRSIPLFYGVHGQHCTISDSAETVRSATGCSRLDDAAVKEFLLAGYVTGRDTLFADVKQLQAGEYVLFDNRETTAPLPSRYYRFVPGELNQADESELMEQMDAMHVRVFERFVRSANGRRIVIPLSGGLDSRLIAVMLKRLGVENVMCFSYGARGNWEAAVSRTVAERLGYPWHFVRYTRKDWRRWYASDSRWDYGRYAAGLTSRPHFQDWPAVWEMKRTGALQEGDILVPGHSADFLAGSHIPAGLAAKPDAALQDAARSVLRKHYIQWNWQRSCPDLAGALEQRVGTHFEGLPAAGPRDAVGAFELWDWEERQTKFIVNSVRVYEYFGFDWRLPLWDNEMLDFWARVPSVHRVDKKLYDTWLEDRLFPEFGVAGLFPPRWLTPARAPRLARAENVLRVGWFQLTRPEQRRYSLQDRRLTWRMYTRHFGHTPASPIYAMHVMPLGAALYLDHLQQHIAQMPVVKAGEKS